MSEKGKGRERQERTATDEFLAVRFPGVPKSWLQRVSRKLRSLMSENGGNVEMHVRWRAGSPQWTDWIQRDLCEYSPVQDN